MYALFGKFLVALSIGLFIPMSASAQLEGQAFEPPSQENVESISVALDGYDVLTYFHSASPQKGNKTYQATYRDKRYLFVNLENQKKFAADPEKYLPEFDEHCGCAASEGELVKANPEIFKITEGKLVLFENKQALSRWNEDEAELYKKAQSFWKYESEYNANDRLQDDSRVRLFTF